MYYFAMYDETVSEDNPGMGIANRKKAIAFHSEEILDMFLAERINYDLSSKKINKEEAIKLAMPYPYIKGFPWAISFNHIGTDPLFLFSEGEHDNVFHN
jgi:hypothetical protein